MQTYMNDFKALAKLHPLTQKELAKKIGIDRPNLTKALNGERGVPDHSLIKLREILGLCANGALDHDKIHYWVVKGSNLDIVKHAFYRFLKPPRFIGPAIWKENFLFEPVIPVTTVHCAPTILIKQRVGFSDAIKRLVLDETISPKTIENCVWWHNNVKDFGEYYIVVSKNIFEKITSNSLSPNQLLDIINNHYFQYEKWNWKKIEEFGITPDQVAKKFDLPQS
mgnify:CR=1 FL=1